MLARDCQRSLSDICWHHSGRPLPLMWIVVSVKGANFRLRENRFFSDNTLSNSWSASFLIKVVIHCPQQFIFHLLPCRVVSRASLDWVTAAHAFIHVEVSGGVYSGIASRKSLQLHLNVPVNKLRGSGLTMKGMIHNLKEPMENSGLKEENKHSCYH